MAKLATLFSPVSTPLSAVIDSPNHEAVSVIAKQEIANMAKVGIVAANQPAAPTQAQTFTAA